LAPEGMTFTVNVMLKRGGGAQVPSTELAFNQPQVMYLVGHSDTPNARGLHVQYVKGFFMLLDYVWRIETAKYEKPLTPAQVIHKMAELLVKMEAKNAEQEDAITANAAETESLNLVQRVHSDAIQDLRIERAERALPEKNLTHPYQHGKVVKGVPAKAIPQVPPLRKMYSIAYWAKKHKPTNSPVHHSSLGKAATALYLDYYEKRPINGAGVVVDGVYRRVKVYPEHILKKAFKNTPRSKIKSKRGR